MAKIKTYAIDATPSLTDKVIGTEVNNSNATKNYLISDILGLQVATIAILMPSGTSGIFIIPKSSWPGNADYVRPMVIDTANNQVADLPWSYDLMPDPTQLNILIGLGTLPNDFYVLI